MVRGEIYYKNVVIQIFRDHWDQFKRFHKELVDENIEENVEKMMGCGLIENGYYEYICPKCLKKKKIGFSCKSRFCLRCSKVYTRQMGREDAGGNIQMDKAQAHNINGAGEFVGIFSRRGNVKEIIRLWDRDDKGGDGDM